MKKKNEPNGGLEYVINSPLKGEIYTGWVLRIGQVFAPVTYLEIDGTPVPKPTSSPKGA